MTACARSAGRRTRLAAGRPVIELDRPHRARRVKSTTEISLDELDEVADRVASGHYRNVQAGRADLCAMDEA